MTIVDFFMHLGMYQRYRCDFVQIKTPKRCLRSYNYAFFSQVSMPILLDKSFLYSSTSYTKIFPG